MAEQTASEQATTDRLETSKRPWSTPVFDVIPADETNGPANGFPNTDSVTGVS